MKYKTVTLVIFNCKCLRMEKMFSLKKVKNKQSLTVNNFIVVNGQNSKTFCELEFGCTKHPNPNLLCISKYLQNVFWHSEVKTRLYLMLLFIHNYLILILIIRVKVKNLLQYESTQIKNYIFKDISLNFSYNLYNTCKNYFS